MKNDKLIVHDFDANKTGAVIRLLLSLSKVWEDKKISFQLQSEENYNSVPPFLLNNKFFFIH